ncbi:MAG: bifunctional UDP-N-acetylglucosamine diphosphorylase/glucosamine-1-phosphate N-acetyltransferase GlmU [Pseudolysinimonas sp.]|uniref:bifunctional UDP-N-acetylglucosamine diphosphorylase/glucosamine-1-phosphate N-acetyltransferase GlmU n=1 Tax=Pseudolysinimonas sp. TaxID=2680009 RepID=UPI0032668E91
MTDSRLAIIVLAAGQGTRMKSSRPKVLHELAGIPLIGHVLATARELAAAHVLTVVRHDRDVVAAAVFEYLPEAIVVDQDEIPGTGRAVEVAIAALPAGFEGDVVVVSGDVPLLDADTLTNLVEAHRRASAAATLLSAIVDDATGYGRVVRDASGAMLRIVEHRDANDDERGIVEINSGTYVFSVGPLRAQLPRLGSGNDQGERYLTDVVGLLHDAGDVVEAVAAADAWLVEGINDRVQLARAAARLNAMIVRGWQLAGVTVHDPATTWIDLRATLAEDVELLPGTHIAGSTTVASGARIGPDTTLRDCEVGRDAVISRTDATLAVIGAKASVGPFAYLRPGTELGDGGKIGTYVETKNAKIGAGAKVPHLSYMGDVTIGEGTNIGAGGITANYDDVAKHPTTIGAHVHTGVHNSFVAPVTIGDGAKIGAGTVVRKNVPAGALAVSVAQQRITEGWTERNRAGTHSAQAASDAQE